MRSPPRGFQKDNQSISRRRAPPVNAPVAMHAAFAFLPARLDQLCERSGNHVRIQAIRNPSSTIPSLGVSRDSSGSHLPRNAALASRPGGSGAPSSRRPAARRHRHLAKRHPPRRRRPRPFEHRNLDAGRPDLGACRQAPDGSPIPVKEAEMDMTTRTIVAVGLLSMMIIAFVVI